MVNFLYFGAWYCCLALFWFFVVKHTDRIILSTEGMKFHDAPYRRRLFLAFWTPYSYLDWQSNDRYQFAEIRDFLKKDEGEMCGSCYRHKRQNWKDADVLRRYMYWHAAFVGIPQIALLVWRIALAMVVVLIATLHLTRQLVAKAAADVKARIRGEGKAMQECDVPLPSGYFRRRRSLKAHIRQDFIVLDELKDQIMKLRPPGEEVYFHERFSRDEARLSLHVNSLEYAVECLDDLHTEYEAIKARILTERRAESIQKAICAEDVEKRDANENRLLLQGVVSRIGQMLLDAEKAASSPGHKAVSELADQELTRNARQEAIEIGLVDEV